MFLGVSQTNLQSVCFTAFLDDFFPLVFIICIFSSCLILISLAAFQTHYVDIEEKRPAIFQQSFHCFKTVLSFLRPTIFLFLNSYKQFSRYTVFAIVYYLLNYHLFVDEQHPKMGTLFPLDILWGWKGLLDVFHEICSSLSILGWYLSFLQKIIMHFCPSSASDSS